MQVPNPWKILGEQHPAVLLVRLPIAERGRFYATVGSAGAIVVRTGMLLVEERSTLWHELVHLEHRDLPVCNAYMDARQELRCTKEAARRALPIAALCDALAQAHSRPEAADMLKTTTDLLKIRMRHLHPSERAAVRRVLDERADAA